MALTNRERIFDHIKSIGVATEFTASDIEEALKFMVPIKSVRAILKDMSDQGLIELGGDLHNGMKVYFVPEPSMHVASDDESDDADDVLADLDDDAEVVETAPESWVIPGVDLDTPVEIDHSDNESLHNLYVGYAMYALEGIAESIERFESTSRWPDSQVAMDLRVRRKQLIMTDASFFDAAALLTAGFTADEHARHYGNDTAPQMADDLA